MIRIRKGEAPRKLLGDGPAMAQAHGDLYEADKPAFASGKKRLAFSDSIFGHASVRDALATAQHGKCCYCECKPDSPYAHLHVEHWRPKARVRQSRGGRTLSPGYYWLAYDWDNLFLACHFCNSGNKGDVFPLSDSDARARDHHADLDGEDPLLLRPDGPEDPQDHIDFHDEVPVGKTARGRRTIDVLGLDRTDHVIRLRLLDQLRQSRAVVLRYHRDPNPAAVEFVALARGIVERSVLTDAPFSAMASAYVARNPIP